MLRSLLPLILLSTCLVVPAQPAPPDAAEGRVRAQLTSRASAVISAEIAGRIRSLPVLEGGTFAEGDPLLVLDASLQQAQVDRARAVLTAAERTFAANQRLRELRSIGQIEVDLSEAEVAKARAELAYAAAMLAKCTIHAPFAGRMAEQRVHSEEFVQPGQVLFEIVEHDAPQIDFIAPSRWLAWLQVGHPVTLILDENGRTYTGAVERIGAKVDAVSQSVKVVARLTSAPAELIPGMSGTLSLSPQR